MTRSQMLAYIERQLAKRIGRTEQEITQIYAEARRDTRNKMSEIYDKYAEDGELTHAEMTKYNRLDKLEKDLGKRMNRADSKAMRRIKRLRKDQYEEAFFLRAWKMDNELGARLGWGKLSADAVEKAVENPLDKIVDRRLRANSRERIRSAVASGLTRGDSFAQMTKAMRDAINGTRKDALRITRTEGQRAQVLGTQKNHERAQELGVEGREYWVATLDGRTRDRHGELDGEPKNEEKNGWRIPGTNTYTPGPLQSGIAEFDINCRCTVEFRIDDEAPSVRRIRDEGEVEYQSYSAWKNRDT